MLEMAARLRRMPHIHPSRRMVIGSVARRSPCWGAQVRRAEARALLAKPKRILGEDPKVPRT